MQRHETDILVIGSGLAGIAAALTARTCGARVTLVCTGNVCGGSSFSRNTWGLGMVSESPDPSIRASESLFKALESVGMGLNTPELSERLICDADEAIAWLGSQGADIRMPEDQGQREFIPCFDTTVRSWHGFHAQASREALAQRLRTDGITVYDQTELLTLLRHGDRVVGALTLHKMSDLLAVQARATIVATGGLAGLYASHICPSTCANAHLGALEAGARIVNAECVQLMVGYLSPLEGTVFNEKLWRWVNLSASAQAGGHVSERMSDPRFRDELAPACEAHSWHGPFTSERESRLVERLVCADGPGSVSAAIPKELLGPEAPELVRTYCTWLEREKGVSATGTYPLALFAHSSNGGIAIDCDGWTGVPGLYAAGEAAGGVHGADRIGGLASVSALVFGRAAARAAAGAQEPACQNHDPLGTCYLVDEASARALRKRIAHLLDAHALAPRTHEGLSTVAATCQEARELLQDHAMPAASLEDLGGTDARALAAWRRTSAHLLMAEVLVRAMDARTETRGAHWRADHPEHDPALARQLFVSLHPDGQLLVE